MQRRVLERDVADGGLHGHTSRQRASGLDLGEHPEQARLHVLVLDDGDPALHALLRIGEGVIEGRASHPDELLPHGIVRQLEHHLPDHSVGVGAFDQHEGFRHPHFVEEDLALVERALADLVERACRVLTPGQLQGNQEGRTLP